MFRKHQWFYLGAFFSFFLFTFGLVSCIEVENEVKVLPSGAVAWKFTYVLAKEVVEGGPAIQLGPGGKKQKEDPKLAAQRREKKRKEITENMEKLKKKIGELKGISSVKMTRKEMKDGGYRFEFSIEVKDLKSFPEAFKKVHALFPNEKKAGAGAEQESPFQFKEVSLKEVSGGYKFVAKWKDITEGLNAQQKSLLKMMAGISYSLQFRAPHLLATNGNWDKEKNLVVWKTNVKELSEGKRKDIEVTFRLSSSKLWLWLVLGGLVVVVGVVVVLRRQT
ncbi:MAG: hypothetical protein D6805_08065 [Planctomycetota bacterium]|nr:MAG: hypothetical protein D6805_08065 [Planctomycetota bacterium]